MDMGTTKDSGQRAPHQRATLDEAAPGPQTPAVEVRGLHMRYGTVNVLEDVNLTVGRGEVVALLGPNGAGKTTTIEILEGFRRRSAGEVAVLGADPETGDEAWRARLGIVLQSWRDHGRWQLRELLANLGRYYAPFSGPDRVRPIAPDSLLELVGLTDVADAKVMTLSGGQRRRLDVAIGLVGRPELLFLDEPTVGFDPAARREFHATVARLSNVDDASILLTTHDLEEAERLADRIVVLAGGRIVADGTPTELAAQVAGRSEVVYTQGGERHIDLVEDPTSHVRALFEEHATGIDDLEVHRVSLETTYLKLVEQSESNEPIEPPSRLDAVIEGRS